MAKTAAFEKTSGGVRTWEVLALCLMTALFSETMLATSLLDRYSLTSLGRVAMLFLTLCIIHRFAVTTLQYYRPRLKDLLCLHLLLIGSVCIVASGRLLALALSAYLREHFYWDNIHAETLQFAIPYAAGGLIVQSVLGLHYGLVFALCSAILVGIFTPLENGPVFIPYVFVTSLVACLSLARFRSRSAYLKAGFYITLVALPFVFAAFLGSNSLSTVDLLVLFLSAVIGGALCTFIAAGVTPIFEYAGGYVTDMRLIEIATLDNALLKDLSLQAPGTWNHSMVLGMMVEAAASEIGANPVLARVGAYFHDIGKLKKPIYFIENQGGGENRHDKLSTSMSALIVRSHVKDGLELGRKHGIPEAVLDMIPQHHGTSLIEYFYNKACREAGDGVPVDQNLYTYPGPKPQTREAGLLMLADKIESATRTLSEPTLDRIQGLVQKMVNKVFASGQLDECELTLRDLHAIAACFTRVLNSIYHQRIVYADPEERGGAEKSEGSQEAGSKTPEAETGDHNEARPARVDEHEDLKRLGME